MPAKSQKFITTGTVSENKCLPLEGVPRPLASGGGRTLLWCELSSTVWRPDAIHPLQRGIKTGAQN